MCVCVCVCVCVGMCVCVWCVCMILYVNMYMSKCIYLTIYLILYIQPLPSLVLLKSRQRVLDVGRHLGAAVADLIQRASERVPKNEERNVKPCI